MLEVPTSRHVGEWAAITLEGCWRPSPREDMTWVVSPAGRFAVCAPLNQQPTSWSFSWGCKIRDKCLFCISRCHLGYNLKQVVGLWLKFTFILGAPILCFPSFLWWTAHENVENGIIFWNENPYQFQESAPCWSVILGFRLGLQVTVRESVNSNYFLIWFVKGLGLPGWLNGRYGFDPWVGKIPTPTYLSGKSHGQRSLMGYSPWGFEKVGHNLMTKTTTKHKDLVNVFADVFKNMPCSQRNQMPT